MTEKLIIFNTQPEDPTDKQEKRYFTILATKEKNP